MELKNFLIVVKDTDKAKEYYGNVFGLKALTDNGGNVILSGGLVLQQEDYWHKFLGRDITPKNNSCELYFEEKDVDAFYERLKKLYPETEFVNLPMMHSWGQKVVRFYDPYGNLIEVGTPM
ncbi:MAG: VOC family protein [Clostridia bacterium]|nr:VOC family protein [Clostridia bacterium]